MANRTQRTAHAEVLLAQRHRAEHDTLTRRLGGVDQELLRLEGLITERNTELARAASEAMREIIRTEIERLENQISERGNERQDIIQRLSDIRQDLDDLTGRVGTVENNVLGLGSRVDGLQAHSEAHATAIIEIQDRLNGPWFYVPVAGVVFFLGGWLMLEALASLPLWRDLVISGAIGCVAAAIVAGIGFGGRSTRVAASASSGATLAPQPPVNQPPAATTPPQPPADQPPVAGVTPPPPPPSGSQFSTVQAAAAASASQN